MSLWQALAAKFKSQKTQSQSQATTIQSSNFAATINRNNTHRIALNEKTFKSSKAK